MQAILTKYHGPTEHCLTGRISARCSGGSVSIPASRFLTEHMHVEAARQLCVKLGWVHDGYTRMVSGCLPNGTYAHVFAGGES